MKKKKIITSVLYGIGILIFIIAFSIFTVSTFTNDKTTKIVGIVFFFLAFITIMIAFGVDFIDVMVINETEGDQFTLMSKEKLKSILDKAEIEYDEDKGREYYLYLVRENVSKE